MLQSFPRGGVHPAENKFSAEEKITTLPLPKTVNIPLSQHIGAPAEVTVNRGDIVKTGEVIGKHRGFVSSNIHSSVSGKVLKIDKTLDSSGYKRISVTIEVNEDHWLPEIDQSIDLKKEITISGEEIVKKNPGGRHSRNGWSDFPFSCKTLSSKRKESRSRYPEWR